MPENNFNNKHYSTIDFKKAITIPSICILFFLAHTQLVFADNQCNTSIADIYESKSPAVVRISALFINPYKNKERIQQTDGAGFIIDDKGLVMTNSHVVFGAQVVHVTLDNGIILPAKLLGADPIFDVAILQIPEPSQGSLPILKFADSDKLKTGEEIMTIGNPLGLGQTITSGIVSGLNRSLHERPRLLSWPMIQTDIPINPGNSGGPILNHCGEVVGITSEMMRDAQNIGFAIPSNLAKSTIESLKSSGRVIRSWLGFDGQLINKKLTKIFNIPIEEGFLVESIEQGSPANLAGLHSGNLPIKINYQTYIFGGDIIIAINNIELNNDENMLKALNLVHIGSKLDVTIFRNGEVINTTLEITERPIQPGDVPESSQTFSISQKQDKSDGKDH